MTQTKRALIICAPDAYANAVKPKQLGHYLTARGYATEFLSTIYLSRMGSQGLGRFLPGASWGQWKLYSLEALDLIAGHLPHGLRRGLRSKVYERMLRQRGSVLSRHLAATPRELIICENNLDIAFLEHPPRARLQIIDLPAPFAEELYYGGELTSAAFNHLRDYEAALYGRADYLSFHWHTYADYVKAHKYNGPNFIDLGYGTTEKTVHAHYSASPRIVFLGYLAGYWVNLPLLKRLCDRYPNLDVYGGPARTELGSHFKGYAPSLDVLATYQFGLITLTDDPLRQSSFSSKQLEYYSYGLPVLTPNWRRDSRLDPAALPYDEDNIDELLAKFSVQSVWEAASAEARRIAQATSWDKALCALDKIT